MKLRDVTEEEGKQECHYCENKAIKAGVDEDAECGHCGEQVLMCSIHSHVNDLLKELDAVLNADTLTTHIQAAMAGIVPSNLTKH